MKKMFYEYDENNMYVKPVLLDVGVKHDPVTGEEIKVELPDNVTDIEKGLFEGYLRKQFTGEEWVDATPPQPPYDPETQRPPRWSRKADDWVIEPIDFEAKHVELIGKLEQIELKKFLTERVQQRIGGGVGIALLEEESVNADEIALIEEIRETRRRIEATKGDST